MKRIWAGAAFLLLAGLLSAGDRAAARQQPAQQQAARPVDDDTTPWVGASNGANVLVFRLGDPVIGTDEFAVELTTAGGPVYLTTKWSDDGTALLAEFDPALLGGAQTATYRLWSGGDGDLSPSAFSTAALISDKPPPPSTAPAPFPAPAAPGLDPRGKDLQGKDIPKGEIVPKPPHPKVPPYGQVPGKGKQTPPTLGILEIPWEGGTAPVPLQSGGKPTPPAGTPPFKAPDPSTTSAAGHAEGQAA